MNLLVADTTVISNFAYIDRLDLLHTAFGTLVVPSPVMQELEEAVRQGYFSADLWASLTPTVLSPDEAARAEALRQTGLGAGEAACIAVVEARGALLLTEDREARQWATSHRLPLSGTLGVLRQLVRSELLDIDEADSLLSAMISYGYFSPVRSIRDLKG